MSGTNGDADTTANIDLQEALGVTPEGNCKRHPNCPVLSLAHNKVMSCRICFSEEKSDGIRQRKSFAAVVQQLQASADRKQQDDADAVAANEQGERLRVQRAHSASLQALIVQQPQTLDSIMKRMQQVQNWILRQKEKEVMSLKLQIQDLEEKLHHSEVQNQENKQTIWALRRTIQQDMRLIKTMTVEKERSMGSSQHGSPMNSSTSSPPKHRSNSYLSDSVASFLDSPDKSSHRLGGGGSSVANSINSSPMTSPAGKYFSAGAGPNTPDNGDEDDTTTITGGDKTPEAMQGIVFDNPSQDSKGSDPLLDKVRQKKKALQSKFQELRAAHSSGKQVAPLNSSSGGSSTTSSSGLLQPKSASAHVPGRPNNGTGAFRRSDGENSLRSQSSRSLDEMLEPPGVPKRRQQHQQQDFIAMTPSAGTGVRIQYWNEEHADILSTDPNKILASFRGDRLNIPKSPPANSQDPRQRDRPKLQLDEGQMSALKMPRMRGVGRTLSYQSDADNVSVDLSVEDNQSLDGFSVTSQSLGSAAAPEGPREIPLHSLAASLESLSLSRSLHDEKPEHLFEEKQEEEDDDKSTDSFEQVVQAQSSLTMSQTAAAAPVQPKHNVRKPKKAVNSEELVTVPEVDEDLYSSKSNFDFNFPGAGSAPSALAHPVLPVKMTKMAQVPQPPSSKVPASSGASGCAAVQRPPSAPKMTQDDEKTRGDETADTTPSFFTESVASAMLSNEREKEKEKEKFLFTVTGAKCQDKYGDTGLYTGTILVTEALPHGKGCMKYDTGRVYDGDWVSGQWHGHGKLQNPNGDTYEGDFVLDARHGKGEYRWENGDVYTGDFSYDRRNGNGKFCFHNGNVYEGEFVDGMFEGFGRYDFDDGYYEGEWRQGRYHGDGELQYANGGKYTGEFRESLAHGFGVETLPDGTKRRGVWERGQPVEFYHRSSEASHNRGSAG